MVRNTPVALDFCVKRNVFNDCLKGYFRSASSSVR